MTKKTPQTNEVHRERNALKDEPGLPEGCVGPQDAKRGEVAIYAFGNIEESASNQFFIYFQQILTIAMHVHPMLLGLILGVRTLIDAVTDPIMAYITDNARTRWGRRRPFILVGGVLRMLLLIAICVFIPRGGHLSSNSVMEAQKFANEAVVTAGKAQESAVKIREQIETAEPEIRLKMLGILSEREVACAEAIQKMEQNRDALVEDVARRKGEVEDKQAELDTIRTEFAESPELEEKLIAAQGRVDFAEGKFTTADQLLKKMNKAHRQAIATVELSRYMLDAFAADSTAPQWGDIAAAQARADILCATAGLEPLSLFEIDPPPPPQRSAKKKGSWAKITDGIAAFKAPENAAQQKLVVFILIVFVLFALFTTVNSVPYYALGIELCPSYDGRTRVVAYRGFIDQATRLLMPWIPALCFSLWFANAIDGLFWVAAAIGSVGICTTVLLFWKVRERTEISTVKKEKINIFVTMWQLAKNPHFLRIFALYALVMLTTGMFQLINFYLNVYWVMGSALSGAKIVGAISMIASVLGMACIPLINTACRRFEKHRALRFGIIWMAAGAALKWWCMNPDHPEYQIVLPFFYSVGIISVYTILPTLMADVTDMDELENGFRREGMFGAVMSFMNKIVGTFVPILAGVALAIAGIDPSLEYRQLPDTIFRLRLMDSFIPAGMLLICLVVLWKYPLTRRKVEEVKSELHRRHQAERAGANE
ncbi:Glucuronide carrier protein [Pontiella desulfatans]|uniref:Glucuronide carrier protein n=1 Tax=Pontiella desulfatans TaxID=2750659 RepID=A0A6C2U5F6_PONDE|nr:MFS transporter [Pontiella desulfatans]VGO15069.1 Glucuronide carrier protein [Pontiella desulfatans]